MIDPNLLNIFGQILNFVGGILLTVDALGALEFLDRLDSTDDERAARMANLSFVATTNNVFVFLVLSLLGFVTLLLCLPSNKIVLSLLLAPLTYFAWKLLATLGDLLHGVVARLSPHRYFEPKGCIAQLLQLLLLLPWLALLIVTFLVSVLIRFGVDLPLRMLAERLIGPYVLRLLRRFAAMQAVERRFSFRRNAFVGLLFIVAGFGYQLVATLLQLIWSQLP